MILIVNYLLFNYISFKLNQKFENNVLHEEKKIIN